MLTSVTWKPSIGQHIPQTFFQHEESGVYSELPELFFSIDDVFGARLIKLAEITSAVVFDGFETQNKRNNP